MTLAQAPVVRTQMLIRRPVREVFEAFVDPFHHDQVLVHPEHRKAGARQGDVGVR